MTDPINHQTILTEEGKRKLEEELEYLKTVKRKDVAKKIEAAKEMGDISENAEYAAAKDEQAFMEARIAEIENLLHYSVLASTSGPRDAVMVGATAEVEDESKKRRAFTIVGYNEANPVEGKISNESPLGQALLGKRVGDSVTVDAPNGKKTYTIVAIS